MKYFLHDTNSFSDEKVHELFLNFGFEGIGLFYTVLEKLAGQEKPIKTVVLKSQLKVGKKLDKCWQFMEDLGIISSNNGETFNERILSYSEKYKIKKEKTREKISEWRKNQSITENVTSYEPVCNPPKVNESKVNLTTVTDTVINKEKVIEYLRGAAPISTQRTEIDKMADELMKFYQGKKIGSLRSVCNKWMDNYSRQETMPIVVQSKEMQM